MNMSSWREINRGTGRTTRVIEKAIQRAKEGRETIIVVPTQENKHYAKEMLFSMMQDVPSRKLIKIVDTNSKPSTIECSKNLTGCSWVDISLSKDSDFMFDPSAISNLFGTAIDRLFAFDLQNENS